MNRTKQLSRTDDDSEWFQVRRIRCRTRLDSDRQFAQSPRFAFRTPRTSRTVPFITYYPLSVRLLTDMGINLEFQRKATNIYVQPASKTDMKRSIHDASGSNPA